MVSGGGKGRRTRNVEGGKILTRSGHAAHGNSKTARNCPAKNKNGPPKKRTPVVLEFDFRPRDPFLRVLLLLRLEHLFVKLLMELLVCIVDTKLFETVDLKNFETVNIQNSDEEFFLDGTFEGLVELCYDPVEEIVVNGLRKVRTEKQMCKGTGGERREGRQGKGRLREGILLLKHLYSQ
jgi:hypothetical protein